MVVLAPSGHADSLNRRRGFMTWTIGPVASITSAKSARMRMKTDAQFVIAKQAARGTGLNQQTKVHLLTLTVFFKMLPPRFEPLILYFKLSRDGLASEANYGYSSSRAIMNLFRNLQTFIKWTELLDDASSNLRQDYKQVLQQACTSPSRRANQEREHLAKFCIHEEARWIMFNLKEVGPENRPNSPENGSKLSQMENCRLGWSQMSPKISQTGLGYWNGPGPGGPAALVLGRQVQDLLKVLSSLLQLPHFSDAVITKIAKKVRTLQNLQDMTLQERAELLSDVAGLSAAEVQDIEKVLELRLYANSNDVWFSESINFMDEAAAITTASTITEAKMEASGANMEEIAVRLCYDAVAKVKRGCRLS
ncbi:hypothetical protein HAX54_008463 [Datura stramonium]|uniref:Uncharacterized protein n=1 Tax=Datura stramonium TaxID=4076 RepID=A0ABS8TEL9_DATST|nr:hypothetical protein [Datura stramonium]